MEFAEPEPKEPIRKCKQFLDMLFGHDISRQTIEHRALGSFMNNEKERIWKEPVVAKQRHYPAIFPEGPNKTTKHIRIIGVTTKIRT
jgi:hypothetical protein